MTKPYLALFRAGASSLHPHAVARLADQNFDYALSWFGDTPPGAAADGAVFVHPVKGAKWPGLEATLAAHWDTLQQYRYVWLPDDDLLCVPEDVSRLFAICDDLQLELAQPALTPDSYHSHVATLQHSAFQLRFTNFVEIMAPLLSIDMLARVYPTLRGQVSGFGLDGLWPRYSALGRVAIVDDTPVRHTRPVGGPNYAYSDAAGLRPAHEDWLVSARHFIETPGDCHIVIGGLLQNGDAICIGDKREDLDRMLRLLLESTRGHRISALALTRYLSNHLHYWSGDANATRYPRDLVRVVLNQALKHAGIRFSVAGGMAPAAAEQASVN